MFHSLSSLCFLFPIANAYFLVASENVLTQQRLDPIVTPGAVAGHVHTVIGGSNFGITTNTSHLRNSECTTNPIKQDKSSYWFPSLYFQWKNGSFSSVSGGAVTYYLFSDKAGTTTPFPDDFRMISGDPKLRTYDPTSYAQQAVSFLCLDFNGNTTRHTGLPTTPCPSGVRAQLNFPSCWNGKDTDSPDHKSHVSYLSGGPDVGTCNDPKFPVTLPRIFQEFYLDTGSWDKFRSEASNPAQPFVYSMGDPTGNGYHGDFLNGWESGVLQKVVDKCNCNPFGDPTCCAQAGIFDLKPPGQDCRITDTVDEQTTGTIPKLPGNNPVQSGARLATVEPDTTHPGLISPVYVYTGATPTATGKVSTSAYTPAAAYTPIASAAQASPSAAKEGTPRKTCARRKRSTRNIEQSLKSHISARHRRSLFH